MHIMAAPNILCDTNGKIYVRYIFRNMSIMSQKFHNQILLKLKSLKMISLHLKYFKLLKTIYTIFCCLICFRRKQYTKFETTGMLLIHRCIILFSTSFLITQFLFVLGLFENAFELYRNTYIKKFYLQQKENMDVILYFWNMFTDFLYPLFVLNFLLQNYYLRIVGLFQCSVKILPQEIK